MIYRLATFIQISDLLFGDIHPRTGEIVYDRGVRWAWSWFPACLGFAGHEARALIDLRDFFDEHFPAENDEPVALLVTGDLTSTGKREQFNDARQYLSEELEPPKGNSLGLNRPEWWDRAIPGNHDHWPGRPFMMGTYRTWVRKWRREFPYTGVPYELGSSGVRLRFMGINTDADIAPWSPDRFLARGNFISQLEALVEEMKTQPNTLLVHRVWMKNKKVVWETETWKRDHYDGFVRVLSREPPFADRLVVLPRPHG